MECLGFGIRRRGSPMESSPQRPRFLGPFPNLSWFPTYLALHQGFPRRILLAGHLFHPPNIRESRRGHVSCRISPATVLHGISRSLVLLRRRRTRVVRFAWILPFLMARRLKLGLLVCNISSIIF